MNNRNDTDLIEEVLGGDTEAFGVLVERYSDRIFSLISRICGNREDAEEAVQDTFLKAYGHLGKFRQASSFSSWIYRIAYNTAISHVRKNKPLRFFSEWKEERTRIDSEEDTSSFSQWEKKGENREEKLQRLEKALKKLPSEEQALLVLFYQEDRNVREIAEIVSQSEGNVRIRLHRIRKRLNIIYNEL